MQRFFDSLKKGFLTTGALFFAGYKSGKTRFFQPFQHFFGVVSVGEGPHLHPEQAVSLGLGRELFRLGRSIGHPQILAEAPGDGLADFIGVLDDPPGRFQIVVKFALHIGVGAAGVRTSYSRELAWIFSEVPGVSGARAPKIARQASYPFPGTAKQNSRVPVTFPLKALVWTQLWMSAPKALDSAHLWAMLVPNFASCTSTPQRRRAAASASAILWHWTCSLVLPQAYLFSTWSLGLI